MNIPISIKDKIESLASSYDISDLKKSANKISSLYMEEASSGEPLVFSNIDVLTLSATPIPRTLQISLLGVRSLSQINTPPNE